jgi:integrase
MKIPRVYPSDGSFYYVQDLDERNPRTGRPRQKWHKLCRIDEGEAALHAALAALLGEPPAPVGGNMPELIKTFSAEYFAALTFDVRKEYERMFEVIAKAFVKFNANQVEPGDVIAFLAKEFTGHLNTQGKYKARLSTFFSWCVRNQGKTGVEVNPCREIKIKSPPKRRGRLNSTRYWAIYNALTPMGQCFMELAYLTRQRPTEIRLLRESHISADRIHFEPSKTEDSSGEVVDILITPEIRACLDRARSLRPKHKVADLAKHRDPYIIQARDGDKYTKNGFYEVWRDAVEAAGCKGITTRDIRPYALSVMETLGADLREIQKSAVHTTVGSTEVYLDQYRERFSDFRMPLPEGKS